MCLLHLRSMNDGSEDRGDYDLAPEPAPKPVAVKAVPFAPLNYRAPREERAARDSTVAIRDFQMPIWLLVGGIVIKVIAAMFRNERLLVALLVVGIELILGTGVMLAGVLLAAKWRQIDLGSLPTAALKLAAISIAPAAAVDLLRPMLMYIPLGGLIGWGISFVLYFALIGALFELDESDTWYCVWVIFLVRLAAYFAITFGLARWM